MSTVSPMFISCPSASVIILVVLLGEQSIFEVESCCYYSVGESALGFFVDVFLYVFCFVGDCRAACTLGFVGTFFAFLRPEFVLFGDFFYELFVGYFYGAVCEVSYGYRVFHGAESVAAVEFVVEA